MAMGVKKSVDVITMGCSKNLVDSEYLIKQFEANGYHCEHDAAEPKGDIVVINTCGFINDAKEESIEKILEFAQAKEEGRISKLFVMGCLSQRYMKELQEEIPQVDKYYGKFNYKDLIADLGGSVMSSCEGKRHLTTPSHYAYIKISEGCNRRCAYCAIPIITGQHNSRTVESIITEMEDLAAQGVKEFQIIAQELTSYGIDFDGKQHIAELIDRMADVKGAKWIRLHYAYPANFPYDLLRVIRERPERVQVSRHRIAAHQRQHASEDAPPCEQGRDIRAHQENKGRGARHTLAHHPDDRLPRRDRRGLRGANGVHT